MPISKGEAWGEQGALPRHGVVVRSDIEALDIVTAARRAGEPIPPLGLLGGDLCRTLGGRATRHAFVPTGPSGCPSTWAPSSSMGASTGSWRTSSRAHGWWRGRVVAAMNAEFIGDWDVAPRGHPNDGRLDVFDADLPFDERLQVRARLKHGTHVPHPRIEERHQSAVQLEFERPTPVYLDGRRLEPAKKLSVRLEPDALLCVV